MLLSSFATLACFQKELIKFNRLTCRLCAHSESIPPASSNHPRQSREVAEIAQVPNALCSSLSASTALHVGREWRAHLFIEREQMLDALALGREAGVVIEPIDRTVERQMRSAQVLRH